MDKTANGIELPNEMEQANDEIDQLKATITRAAGMIGELMGKNARLKDSLESLVGCARHGLDHLSRDSLEARHRLREAVAAAIKTLSET